MDSPSPERLRRRVQKRRSKPWRRFLVAAGVLVLVLLALDAIHLLVAARDLQDGGTALKNAAAVLGRSPSTWTEARIASARRFQEGAERMLRDGQDGLDADPGFWLAGRLPWLKEQTTGVRDLGGAAYAGSLAMKDVLTVADAYLATKSSADPPGRRLLKLLAATGAPLADASRLVGPPLDRLRGDRKLNLVGPLRRRIDQAVAALTPVYDLASSGTVAARYAPRALGASQPTTYLLLFQNPAELRPSGGLVADAGVITLDNGAIQHLEIKPDAAYNPYPKRSFPIPYPLERYLNFVQPSAEIAEVGWDPDFPTSAKRSEEIYQAATGNPVEGTVAIDPYAIASFLGVTGPVTVGSYGEFNAANFFTKLDFIVNVSQDAGAGKGALGPIAQSILQKLLSQPVSKWPDLIDVFRTAADQRHVQVYFHDPTLAAASAGSPIGGAVLGSDGDYLMVADGNVGGTKGDFYTKKTASLKAEAPASGPSRHQLALGYTLPLPVDNTDRALNPHDGSYADYVRMYLPENAQLQGLKVLLDGADMGGRIDTVTFEHGKQVVGAFFRLPRGHHIDVVLDYVVPVAQRSRYSLYVQKEAGIPERATTVDITYPGGRLKASTQLQQDASWSVGW